MERAGSSAAHGGRLCRLRPENLLGGCPCGKRGRGLRRRTPKRSNHTATRGRNWALQEKIHPLLSPGSARSRTGRGGASALSFALVPLGQGPFRKASSLNWWGECATRAAHRFLMAPSGLNIVTAHAVGLIYCSRGCGLTRWSDSGRSPSVDREATNRPTSLTHRLNIMRAMGPTCRSRRGARPRIEDRASDSGLRADLSGAW